jgi:hypothetical protein
MSYQRNPREQARQQRCGALNGFGRPLTLGFDAEMAAGFFEGDFQLPAHDKPLDDLLGSSGLVSTQQTHRFILPQRVTDQDPADRNGRQTIMEPNRGLRGDRHRPPLSVIPPQLNGRPCRFRCIQILLRRRQALALAARTSLARIRWRGVIQGGVQSQAGHDSDRQGLANGQQRQGSIRTISDNKNRVPGQPPSQLTDHLLGAVGQLFGFSPAFLVVTLRRSQDSHHRQRPYALRPRQMRQPHQTDPAQATRFHHVALTRPHRIAVNPSRCDLVAPASFNRVIHAKYQRFAYCSKGRDPQTQQLLRDVQRRPGRSTEHVMVLGKSRLVFQAHDPQGRRDCSFSRCQNGSDQQDLCFGPRCHATKAWRKWVEQVYHDARQVGPRFILCQRFETAYPAFPFSAIDVQSRAKCLFPPDSSRGLVFEQYERSFNPYEHTQKRRSSTYLREVNTAGLQSR